ncbi:hypothetical protein Hdeb2414_s0044g00743011 [Helianthus debilis subsp. tardiflorus]
MATIGLQQQEQNKDQSLSPQSEIELFLQGFNFTNICFCLILRSRQLRSFQRRFSPLFIRPSAVCGNSDV